VNRRDRLIGAVALLVVLVLAALIVLELQEARDNGVEERENLRLEQVQQLARSMDIRIEASYTSAAGFIGTSGWSMTPGDQGDQERLRRTVGPNARTGNLLVDRTGTITNGVLLSSASVGDRLDRPGLDAVLGDSPTPALLPVASGVTTSLPTVAFVLPLTNDAGAVIGVHITELEVTADSSLAQEVKGLRTDGGGVFTFLDANGVVVASSDGSLLGTRPSGPSYRDPASGFHRGDGRIAAVATVPSADFTLVFDQSVADFEGHLVRPLRAATLLLIVVALIGGAVTVVALIRRLAAAREEQRRLARITEEQEEFTSIVSHELRTPVTGLLGFLETVLDHWETMPDDERRSAVSRAAANAARLHALTRDVLESASIDNAQLQYHFDIVDLRGEVESAVLAARDVEPERPVEVELPDEPVWVSADAVRIQQVLLNLLDNASGNSPTGTPIRVIVRSAIDAATVAVSDNGPGIAPDQVERVFDRYVRGRPEATRGSGLGLYISRRIMEAHTGRIWVDKTDGTGATIAFSLPLVPERTAIHS